MRSLRAIAYFTVIALSVSAACAAETERAERRTKNLFLLTLDGARTQEIFGGLDLAVLKDTTKDGKAEETPVYKRFWASTPGERREKLMPFFWRTLMAKHGSIAGNRALGSTVRITNEHRFSYPGYSEILTGEARDDVITSNDKKLNPSPTVLELLKRKLSLDSRGVAAFSSWDVLDSIVMHEAGAFTSNAGFEAYEHPDPLVGEMSRLQTLTVTPWDTVRHDVFTFRFAMAHVRTYKPRVLYIALGETDDWSHDGRYDRTLEALERTDMFLRELWELIETTEAYRGKTTIIVTTDHGRGNTTSDWRDHGTKIEGAQYIWIACVSPDSSLRGEWSSSDTVYQNQIAATLCRFLGVDYAEQNPRAGKPIARFFDG